MKYAPAADALQLGWMNPFPSQDDLLMVEVEQYMLGRRQPLLFVFSGLHRGRGAVKRLLMDLTLGVGDLDLCP
jgi:hypothetical protein